MMIIITGNSIAFMINTIIITAGGIDTLQTPSQLTRAVCPSLDCSPLSMSLDRFICTMMPQPFLVPRSRPPWNSSPTNNHHHPVDSLSPKLPMNNIGQVGSVRGHRQLQMTGLLPVSFLPPDDRKGVGGSSAAGRYPTS